LGLYSTILLNPQGAAGSLAQIVKLSIDYATRCSAVDPQVIVAMKAAIEAVRARLTEQQLQHVVAKLTDIEKQHLQVLLAS
jgi:DNA-binding FrmR family transcriptional regulator